MPGNKYYWFCDNCGVKNLVAKGKQCTDCGTIRGDESRDSNESSVSSAGGIGGISNYRIRDPIKDET